MTTKELKKDAKILIQELGLTALVFNAFIELFEKGKIAKPDVLFKKSISKIGKAAKYPFLYMVTPKQKNFFMGFDLPIGNVAIGKELMALRKSLSKTKKPKEQHAFELQIAFYEELKKLNPKAFVKGVAKFKEEIKTDEGTEVYLKPLASGLIRNKVEKDQIGNLVNTFRYTTQIGVTVLFDSQIGDEEDEDTTNDSNQQENSASAPKDNILEAFQKAIKDAKGKGADEWTKLLSQVNNHLTKATDEQQKIGLTKLKKEILLNYIKSTGVNVKDQSEVKNLLDEIVHSIQVSFTQFMIDDFKLSADFKMINTAHARFYKAVMTAQSQMNVLVKAAGMDWKADDNFERFKKPVSISLQKASKARNVFKVLAENDAKIRKLAVVRDKAGAQEKMEALLEQTKKHTQKLISFLKAS
ncbi:hypothetical protein [Aureispira anguillae]|uniref:Uncharacterized protein n=1 Tax=Aureispira anguillae TaxID=2864201 RepID=A0A915YJ98_9BACT|nr:hypothetical protein [Aureispira anguillae]BDS14017.1 hypothetical protein AsAng_0047800 [Aureispira anguillae]